jgi:hypothetical protein
MLLRQRSQSVTGKSMYTRAIAFLVGGAERGLIHAHQHIDSAGLFELLRLVFVAAICACGKYAEPASSTFARERKTARLGEHRDGIASKVCDAH